jgi:hypothetical protein
LPSQVAISAAASTPRAVVPEDVARDLREEKITERGAREVHGVLLSAGAVDETATAAERARLRDVRRARSTVAVRPSARPSCPALDGNPVAAASAVACRHCGEILGGSGRTPNSPSDRLVWDDRAVRLSTDGVTPNERSVLIDDLVTDAGYAFVPHQPFFLGVGDRILFEGHTDPVVTRADGIRFVPSGSAEVRCVRR